MFSRVADSHSAQAGRMVLAVLAGSVLMLAGCARAPHPLLTEAARERARLIEMGRIEARADTPPVPLQQALDEGRGRIIERPPPAPGELRLGLAEVRKAALENNLDIQVQLFAPALARERASEAEAAFEALFFGSIARERREPPALVGPESDLGEANIGFQIPLRNGALATLSLGGSDIDIDGGNVGDGFATSASLSVSQPLLRGAGRDANTAPITIARLQRGQEEARTKLTVMRVLGDAETAYWRLYAAARALDIRYRQYERAREQLRQASRLADSGVIARVEVTRARAGVSRRVDDIIRAETLRRSSERNLKRILNIAGVDVVSSTLLLATSEPNPVGLNFDIEKLAADAIAARMDMLELELQTAIDALSLDLARNDEKPLLSIDYSLNYLGNESSLSDTLDQAFRGDRQGWRVGARLELPLGNEAANARRRQAILQRALTLRTRDQREIAIRQEVVDAADLLQEAWRRILAAREETLLAGQTLEAENRQFLAGVRTSTDVLQAADFLAEAQIREVSALSEYEIARVGLAFASGTVLGHGRVRLVPYDDSEYFGYKPYGLQQSPATERLGPGAVLAPEKLADKTPVATLDVGASLNESGDFTLQLATLASESDARAYIASHGLGGRAWVHALDTTNRLAYAVFHGRYSDRDAAADALAKLAAALKADGAFVRIRP